MVKIDGIYYKSVFGGCSPTSYGYNWWQYPFVFEKVGTAGNLKKFYTGLEIKTVDKNGNENYSYCLDGGVYDSRGQAMEQFGY